MKPGITQLCLGKENLAVDLEHTRNCGYEAIELVFSDTGAPSIDSSNKELENVKQACAQHGLEICSILATRKDGGSMLSPDPAERKKRQAILRRGLEIAEVLGVDGMLLHPGHLSPDDSYERAWNDCRDALKELAPDAEKHKCAIGIENVWNKFILSPREARQFIDEIGSDYIGIYLDTANLLHYGFTEMWIRELGKRIKKVHVKDYIRKGAQWVQLTDGDCNWPGVMKELRAIGFDGALVCEVGGDENKMKETADHIRRIIEM